MSAAPGRGRIGALTLGALGVVFGDIGTSPLYAVQTVFSIDHGEVAPTRGDVYGVMSMIFWSITVIVSLKYVVFILRADNDGEGGVMALAALARQHVRGRTAGVAMLLGVLGASLFYGDSVITPAISVLSAIEGLSVPAPRLSHWVVPIGVAIITLLFVVQRAGTHAVGRFFGPIMVLWFAALAAMGLGEVVTHPGVVAALLPTYAVAFVVAHPYVAFVAMGAVVLAITGAEALYADMGHFGRVPIRIAWFAIVFPCLVLDYLGQASLVLRDPRAVANPFYLLAPAWAQWPLVVLATAATVIASQAVISGAFSVSRQAGRLGYLPRLTVLHTSEHEGGQIYVPAVNWILYAGVMALLLVFESSTRLATAYGLAVTGTFLLTTALFLLHARTARQWPAWALVVVGLGFAVPELTYFGANITKVVHGGWLPLVIATAVATIMLTWRRGGAIVTARRSGREGSLGEFGRWLRRTPVATVPGTAVFLHHSTRTVPLALRVNTRLNHVIHERVVIVTTVWENVPHVPPATRLVRLPDIHDELAISRLELHYGFQDDQDIPAALERVGRGELGFDLDLDDVVYFLSRITLHRGSDPSLAAWRKRLFIALAHNAASPTEFFHLPQSRTLTMGATVYL